MMQTIRRVVICATVVAILAWGAAPVTASVITFNEAQSTGVGFNAQPNQFLLSSDGLFRVEAFWLNTPGHFHTSNFGFGNVEANHNNSLFGPSNLQGIRITKVDGGAFDVVSMDLFGQASAGQLTNFTTGAGTYTLFTDTTGVLGNGATISFGSMFTNVTQFYLLDPGAAGGTSSSNSWDNIVVNAVATPEPASFALWSMGAIGMAIGAARRKRRQQAA